MKNHFVKKKLPLWRNDIGHVFTVVSYCYKTQFLVPGFVKLLMISRMAPYTSMTGLFNSGPGTILRLQKQDQPTTQPFLGDCFYHQTNHL